MRVTQSNTGFDLFKSPGSPALWRGVILDSFHFT